MLWAWLVLAAPQPFDDSEVLGRVLHRLDANGDGLVQAQEAARGALASEATLDANGDGVVVAAELEQWIDATSPRARTPGTDVATFADGSGGPAAADATAWVESRRTPVASAATLKKTEGANDAVDPALTRAGAKSASGSTGAPPVRKDIPEDPTKIQVHLVDLGGIAGDSGIRLSVKDGKPIALADDGELPDARARDGVYTALIDRPPTPLVELTVESKTGTWTGRVVIARGTATRPVPIELKAGGTLRTAQAGETNGPLGPGAGPGPDAALAAGMPLDEPRAAMAGVLEPPNLLDVEPAPRTRWKRVLGAILVGAAGVTAGFMLLRSRPTP